MELFIRLFYAVLLIGLGVLILKYRKQVKSWTGGGFVWAERYIGRGGTYLVLIGFGIGCIIMGAMIPFGGLDELFGL